LCKLSSDNPPVTLALIDALAKEVPSSREEHPYDSYAVWGISTSKNLV
jgi:hypothetical protein